VLVLGAGGQVAQELRLTQPSHRVASYLTRAELDITDAASVAAALEARDVSWVINSAAYTAVDRAEEQPELAEQVNGLGPGVLADCCRRLGIRLLHLSTDFVFDGAQGSPYRPGDATNPQGAYGRSKLAGEQAVLESDPSAVVLRTSWVYSRYGSNFVKTMLRLLAERDHLGVVDDQVGSPTWARGLAATCWEFLDQPDAQGLYHWSDAGVCSWYDFALAIRELGLAAGLLQEAAEVAPIASEAYPTPAVRPPFSVLDKASTWQLLGRPGCHWRAQLRAMLNDLASQEVSTR